MGCNVRLKKVTSSRAKHLRFEPLGALYEREEVHHVGSYPVLEDQICRFTPEGYEGDESPNNADAHVFACAELFPARAGLTPGDLYGDPLTDDERATI
jgi:phage terminase large subunit-like protein